MNRHSTTSDAAAERVQEHFEDAASQFDGLYQREHERNRVQQLLRPGLFVRADAAVELVSSYDSPRVLDIGCGSGRVGELMLDAGASSYTGIDFSQPMLDLAAERLKRFGPKVKLVSSDFLEGDLDGPFDVVAALGFFDYLPEPEPFTRRMGELCSGSAIASFPKWTPIKGPLRKVRYEWINKCPIFNYTEPQLRELFGDSGFEPAEIERKHAGYLVRAHRG